MNADEAWDDYVRTNSIKKGSASLQGQLDTMQAQLNELSAATQLMAQVANKVLGDQAEGQAAGGDMGGGMPPAEGGAPAGGADPLAALMGGGAPPAEAPAEGGEPMPEEGGAVPGAEGMAPPEGEMPAGEEGALPEEGLGMPEGEEGEDVNPSDTLSDVFAQGYDSGMGEGEAEGEPAPEEEAAPEEGGEAPEEVSPEAEGEAAVAPQVDIASAYESFMDALKTLAHMAVEDNRLYLVDAIATGISAISDTFGSKICPILDEMGIGCSTVPEGQNAVGAPDAEQIFTKSFKMRKSAPLVKGMSRKEVVERFMKSGPVNPTEAADAPALNQSPAGETQVGPVGDNDGSVASGELEESGGGEAVTSTNKSKHIFIPMSMRPETTIAKADRSGKLTPMEGEDTTAGGAFDKRKEWEANRSKLRGNRRRDYYGAMKLARCIPWLIFTEAEAKQKGAGESMVRQSEYASNYANHPGTMEEDWFTGSTMQDAFDKLVSNSGLTYNEVIQAIRDKLAVARNTELMPEERAKAYADALDSFGELHRRVRLPVDYLDWMITPNADWLDEADQNKYSRIRRSKRNTSDKSQIIREYEGDADMSGIASAIDDALLAHIYSDKEDFIDPATKFNESSYRMYNVDNMVNDYEGKVRRELEDLQKPKEEEAGNPAGRKE